MEIQDIFYLIGSITLILVSILVVIVFVAGYYVKRRLARSLAQIDFLAKDFSSNFGSLAKNWGRVTMVGMIFKILRGFIGRK